MYVLIGREGEPVKADRDKDGAELSDNECAFGRSGSAVFLCLFIVKSAK